MCIEVAGDLELGWSSADGGGSMEISEEVQVQAQFAAGEMHHRNRQQPVGIIILIYHEKKTYLKRRVRKHNTFHRRHTFSCNSALLSFARK